MDIIASRSSIIARKVMKQVTTTYNLVGDLIIHSLKEQFLLPTHTIVVVSK